MAPAHFKTELPYRRTNEGIILETFWGVDKIEHDLLLDNHSPTWGNNTIINGNKSVHLSADVGYKTTTGDGTSIKGDVFVCDSVFVGGIAFKQVTFYKIGDDKYLVGHTPVTGALGDNIMAAGIWKIDFKSRTITIASELDSIQGVDKATKISATFNDNNIFIETQLKGKTSRTFELDLGFNLTCLIPVKDFTSIYNKQQKSLSSSLSTPAGFKPINVLETSDSIKIGNSNYPTFVIAHQSAKQNLIGLAFFEQFNFIILDYVNKAFYMSTK